MIFNLKIVFCNPISLIWKGIDFPANGRFKMGNTIGEKSKSPKKRASKCLNMVENTVEEFSNKSLKCLNMVENTVEEFSKMLEYG